MAVAHATVRVLIEAVVVRNNELREYVTTPCISVVVQHGTPS